MNKTKPNLIQLRKLVIFWLTNIIESKHGLDSSLEYVKETTAGPKEFFGALFYTYAQLTESDKTR